MPSNVDILNALRNEASASYNARIPSATNSNLNAIATAIAKHTETANEFLTQMINKICMVEIEANKFDNPLKPLKKGSIQAGKDIEHVTMNPAIAKQYSLTSEDLLKNHAPDVKTLYYTVNSERKYPVTITKPKMIQAITTEGGLDELINMIIGSLYNGDEFDEFTLTKQLVNVALTSDHVVAMDFDFDIATMTPANSTELIKAIKIHSSKMTFPTTAYNKYDKIKEAGEADLIAWSKKKDQIILIDSAISTNMDVDVLANAFNLSKAEFLARKIEVDTFGESNVFAILCDKSWFQIRDSYYELDSFYNGDKLTFNYFLHHWQSFSYCLFSNAMVFRKKPTAGV